MVESNNNNQFYIQYRTPINNVVAKSIVNANKQKNAKSLTEANLEKIRKQRRESARKRANSMTEADKEAKRQRDRELYRNCLLYTSPSPRDKHRSRMPSSA